MCINSLSSNPIIRQNKEALGYDFEDYIEVQRLNFQEGVSYTVVGKYNKGNKIYISNSQMKETLRFDLSNKEYSEIFDIASVHGEISLEDFVGERMFDGSCVLVYVKHRGTRIEYFALNPSGIRPKGRLSKLISRIDKVANDLVKSKLR